MIKILSFCTVCTLFTLALSAHSSIEQASFSEPYSEIDEDALEKVADIVPENWGVIALAQGDLNRDSYTDYALIIQAKTPDEDKTRQEDAFDRLSQHIGPRHLMVVLSEKDKTQKDGHTLKRHRRYRRFIPEYDGISQDRDSLSYLAINAGLLEFRFQGEEPVTRKRHHITYKFRFREDALYLVDYNHHAVNRVSGMFQETSIDLAKGEQKEVFGSMSSPRHQVRKERFKPKDHWTPCEIHDPLNFMPEPGEVS